MVKTTLKFYGVHNKGVSYGTAQRQLDTRWQLTCVCLQSDTHLKWIFVWVIQNYKQQKVTVTGMLFMSAPRGLTLLEISYTQPEITGWKSKIKH